MIKKVQRSTFVKKKELVYSEKDLYHVGKLHTVVYHDNLSKTRLIRSTEHNASQRTMLFSYSISWIQTSGVLSNEILPTVPWILS